MPERNFQYSSYLAPRYWLLWLGLGVARLLAVFPLRAQWALGAVIGSLAYHVLKSRREITQANIRACFPELSAQQQEDLVQASFRSNGIGLIEAFRSWFCLPSRLKQRVRFHGLDNLKAALDRGRGVILLGGHYSTLDLVGSLTTLEFESDVLQRDHSNPLFNAFMTGSRQRLYGKVLGKRDLRAMLKRLRQNKVVWYATDQDYGRNSTVFVPFFGIKCATLSSTMKISRSSGAAVVPFSHFRDEKNARYEVYIHPPLDNFPSDDLEQDAARLNAILEREIRRAPEQYLWMHRRFKTRPNKGEVNIYGKVSG